MFMTAQTSLQFFLTDMTSYLEAALGFNILFQAR